MKRNTLKFGIALLLSTILCVGLTNCSKDDDLNSTSKENKKTALKATLTSGYSVYYTDSCGVNFISPLTGEQPYKEFNFSAGWRLEGNEFVATGSASSYVQDNYPDINCYAKAEVMLVKDNDYFNNCRYEVYTKSETDRASASTSTREWRFEVTPANFQLLSGVSIVSQGWVWGCFNNNHKIDWAEDTRVPFNLEMPSLSTPSLSYSNATSTSVNLSWTASTGNLNVIRYEIYKNGTLVRTATNLTSTVNGLLPNTTYSFYVKALSIEGFRSSASNTVTITTLPDTEAPTVPTNLTSSNITSISATLSWTASTDNVGVTGYRIYQNGTLKATTTNTSYNLRLLSPSTTYTFAVLAYDAANNASSLSSPNSFTTLPEPPTTPTNLTINSNVTLSWTASTRASYYNIYRQMNTGSYTLLATTTSTSYTDNSVLPKLNSSWFYYKVQAVNSGGTSDFSNVVSIQGETYQ